MKQLKHDERHTKDRNHPALSVDILSFLSISSFNIFHVESVRMLLLSSSSPLCLNSLFRVVPSTRIHADFLWKMSLERRRKISKVRNA